MYQLTDADRLAQQQGAETQALVELFNRQVPTAYAAQSLTRRLIAARKEAEAAGGEDRVERIFKLTDRAFDRTHRRSNPRHYARHERTFDTWLQEQHPDSYVARRLRGEE